MNELELLQKVVDTEISAVDYERELKCISNDKKRIARKCNGSTDKPIRLFRSRSFDSTFLPEDLAEYTYPHSSICRIGRANSEGSPVFYASAGGPTTFVEAKCEVGDIVVVSEFRCHNPIILQVIGFSDSEQIPSDFETLIKTIFIFKGDRYYQYSSKTAQFLMQGDKVLEYCTPQLKPVVKVKILRLKHRLLIILCILQMQQHTR